jgi:trans-aconitate methyltransferase
VILDRLPERMRRVLYAAGTRADRLRDPDGVVAALDVRRGILEDLRHAADERGITNLRTEFIPRDHLEIPEPVDLLFVSATYHHLPERTAYLARARTNLRPGGRVAILESRRQGVLARWLAIHASSPRQIKREMRDAGYRLATTHDIVRDYWFGIFEVASA